ncbi:MAG TPA: alkaline phosphatase family protein [Acidimicrobiia bacterium]|nr:alkaline phosphatase family protein [Acidimicrobiia bacterium]
MVLGSIAVAVPAVTIPARATPPVHSAATPIRHLVVIFQENVSFDHYFGTYPVAANTSGQPFDAVKKTPAVNGLADTPGAGGAGTLLTNNPNRDAAGKPANPQRLDPADINDVLTCDQDHDYNDEQKAFDGGAMDKFVTEVGTDGGSKSPTGRPCQATDVMDYYDGNTVTALWNYAQHFAMSDNSFGTTFGPSSPGAINLVSGDTGGVGKTINGADTDGDTVADGQGGPTLVSDAQPYWDDCSTRDDAALTGQNIGNELNGAGLSWGWFEGGFRPTTSFATATGGKQPTSVFTPDEFKGRFAAAPASDQGLCNAVHPVGAAVGGTGGTLAGGTNYGNKDDYIPHHEPFQYYSSTANPHHLPPASLSAIGTDTQTFTKDGPQFDTANHQYDMSDFDALVGAIDHGYLSPDRLPAVSFLKAPGYEDGHGAYSDPIDEQQFITREVNALEDSPAWSSTAVVVAYDDSDGWYDHAFSGIHNASNTANVATPPGPQDFLTGTGLCGDTEKQPPLAGQNGRCGYGPRLPLLVISPWARQNSVDHTLTDQSSVLRFVEDNWKLPRIKGSFDAVAGSLDGLFDFHGPQGAAPKLYLDPTTGRPDVTPPSGRRRR